MYEIVLKIVSVPYVCSCLDGTLYMKKLHLDSHSLFTFFIPIFFHTFQIISKIIKENHNNSVLGTRLKLQLKSKTDGQTSRKKSRIGNAPSDTSKAFGATTMNKNTNLAQKI